MKDITRHNIFYALLILFLFQGAPLLSYAGSATFDSSLHNSRYQNLLVAEYNKQIDHKIKALRSRLESAKNELGADAEGCTSLECQLGDTSLLLQKLVEAQDGLIEMNRANAKSLTYLLGLTDKEIDGLVFGDKSQEAIWIARLFGAENKGGILYQEAVISAQAASRLSSALFNFDIEGFMRQKKLLTGIQGEGVSLATKVIEEYGKGNAGAVKLGKKGNSDINAGGKGTDIKGAMVSGLRGYVVGKLNDQAFGALNKVFDSVKGAEPSTLDKARRNAAAKMSSMLADKFVEDAFAHANAELGKLGKSFSTASKQEIRAALSNGINKGWDASPDKMKKLGANLVGQAALAVGNTFADASQDEELKRLDSLKKQLSEAQLKRIRIIGLWKQTMALHKAMKATKAEQQQFGVSLSDVAVACKAVDKRVQGCLPAIQAKIAAYQSALDEKIKPLTLELERAKAAYEEAAKELADRKAKWQKLLDKKSDLHKKRMAAKDEALRKSLDRQYEMAEIELESFAWVLEESRQSLAQSSLDGAQLAREHAIENATMAMRFHREDARKALMECLDQEGAISSSAASAISGKSVSEADFDLQPAYLAILKIQQEIILALDKASIKATGGEQCKQVESAKSTLMISGSIKTAEGRAISGAVASVDVENKSYSGVSAADGRFQILLPEKSQVPDSLFVIASKQGFNSASKTVGKEHSNKADFVLSAASKYLVQIDQGLHHLGDNNYSGAINSGFQRPSSEGDRYEKSFELNEDQFPPHIIGARLLMSVKGAEEENSVMINGSKIGVLNASNGDGSASVTGLELDICRLKMGTNSLVITAVDSNANGDIDDFELANMQLALMPVEDFSQLNDDQLAQLDSISATDGSFTGSVSSIDKNGAFWIKAKGESRCANSKGVAKVKVSLQGSADSEGLPVTLLETNPGSSEFHSDQAVDVAKLGAVAGQTIVVRSGIRGTKILVRGQGKETVEQANTPSPVSTESEKRELPKAASAPEETPTQNKALAAENATKPEQQRAAGKPERWDAYKLEIREGDSGLPNIKVVKIAFNRTTTRAEIRIRHYPVSLLRDEKTGTTLYKVNWSNGEVSDQQSASSEEAMDALTAKANKLRQGSVSMDAVDGLIKQQLGSSPWNNSDK